MLTIPRARPVPDSAAAELSSWMDHLRFLQSLPFAAEMIAGNFPAPVLLEAGMPEHRPRHSGDDMLLTHWSLQCTP